MEASIQLAKEEGTYETYEGSPTSQGLLQPDLWNVTPSSRWDWAQLRKDLAEHGCRNSLLLAPMPTASTAQILGNNESFEPFTSNMFTRRVLAGEFAVVNKYLLNDLIARGLWTPEIRNQIIADKGSVQGVAGIPDDLKALYKTTWEIKQKCVLDMSADRGAFICQSQSLNLHIAEPSPGKLTSMHFYAWKKGLKTGMYYLRTRPKADAIAFTVDQAMAAKSRGESALKPVNTEPEECLSCGAFVSRVLCFSFARDVHPADLHAAVACTARRHRATPSPRRHSRYTQVKLGAYPPSPHSNLNDYIGLVVAQSAFRVA